MLLTIPNTPLKAPHRTTLSGPESPAERLSGAVPTETTPEIAFKVLGYDFQPIHGLAG